MPSSLSLQKRSLVAGSLQAWSLKVSCWLVVSQSVPNAARKVWGSFVSLLCLCPTRAFLEIAGKDRELSYHGKLSGRVEGSASPLHPICSACFLLGRMNTQHRGCHLNFGSAVLPSLGHAFLSRCSWGPTSLPLLFCSGQEWPHTGVRAFRALRFILSMFKGPPSTPPRQRRGRTGSSLP